MQSLIGQHILIGVSGKSLTADEKKFIIENQIGGVTLFARNVETPKQVHALCQEIQNLRHQTKDKIPLFIGIDQEGGRVARIRAPLTVWPPLKKVGDLNSPTVSFHFANKMGLELKVLGINLNYAPCADIFSNPKNTVIGDRSLSSDPETVAKHVSALIRGYVKAGIIPCAKHFPGHGNTLIDSHEDLPVENATLERLEEFEFVPFKKAFRSRLDLLMTAHIRFPQIDPEWPATLSEIFLKKILRESLRFRGLIFSDDLGMGALTKHYGADKIPVRALKAGVQQLLYCNEPATPPIALEAISSALAQGQLNRSELENNHKQILEIKKKHLMQVDPPPFAEIEGLLAHPDHVALSEGIAKGQVPANLLTEE